MSPRVTKADEHLRRVDHVMRGLIDERGPIHPERDRRGSRPDPYEAIARAIVGQQLSTKAAFLLDLAERIDDGRLAIEDLGELNDEDVIAALTEVKGVGPWTAEMFLIFHLGRPDVLSTGDLGIRRAAQIAYGLDQLPGPGDLERIAEPWRPHRTLGCLYLWRSLDNAPV
jgi:DNA-3-methyladenine glycosylase II